MSLATVISRSAVLAVVASLLTVAGTRPALAACHAFSVFATPGTVTEGGKVTVTVERDGAVAPSSINLSTVEGTAKAGTDYQPINIRVEFTDDVTQQFTVSTINNAVHESKETFKLHLSDPAGCTGSGFSVGPDAGVAIADNDAAPTPTPTPSPTPKQTAKQTTQPTATATVEPETRHASGVPTTSEKPSSRASVLATQSSSPPSPSTVEALAREASGGSSSGLLIGIVVGVLFLGGALTIAIRGHRTRAQ